MSSVLRSVRKRKKSRTLGAVDVIDRAEYADLEVDAKVEVIRSLVPLGLMHIEELLDEEVTALAGERVSIRVISNGVTLNFSRQGNSGDSTGTCTAFGLLRLEFPILSLHPGLRQRCVAPDVWSREGLGNGL